MSNKGMLDIGDRLEEATEEYVARREEFIDARKRLKLCEQKVDELLRHLREEITATKRPETIGTAGLL